MISRNRQSTGAHHALNSFFDGLGAAVSPNSCDLVVLDGHLDHERLRSAIAATLQRHPILCRPLAARTVVEAPTAPSSLPIDLRVHRLDHDRPAAIDAHLQRLIWDEPLDPAGRPVRFHVTETPRRTYLQTIHTHVYADATACYTLTQQLADRYAGASNAPVAPAEPAHATPADLLGTVPGLRERLVRHARGLRRTARDLVARDGGLALPRHRAAGRRILGRICLDEAETAQLLAAARARGHSLHALFQLAYVRAATALHRRRGVERPALRVWDFFSLRPLVEAGPPRYDCLALIYPIDLDARASDGALLAGATERVRHMRSGELVDHAFRFESLRRLWPTSQLMRLWPRIFKSNVFLTNPGVCPSPLPRFGELAVLDYVTFPQLFFPADLLFVFSTFRGRLRILTVRDADAFGASFHAELMTPFLQTLSALGGVAIAPSAFIDGFAAAWTDAELGETRHASLKRSA